jgi:hypothetical protein
LLSLIIPKNREGKCNHNDSNNKIGKRVLCIIYIRVAIKVIWLECSGSLSLSYWSFWSCGGL